MSQSLLELHKQICVAVTTMDEPVMTKVWDEIGCRLETGCAVNGQNTEHLGV